MKVHRNTLLCILFLLTTIASQAFPVAFEEKRPHDEKFVLVPRGARPMLKEEYPRRQLVVERIRARHQHSLIIPFARSWNTAAFTALNGVEMEEEPELEPNDFELGFALHSQRMLVGALRNREYFQKETEGFPEGWYWPLDAINQINRPKGYMSTTFVHLAAKRIRRRYADYRDFADRINGILNVIATENKQLTLKAQRDMQNFRSEGTDTQPRVRNTASIFYKRPGEDGSKLEFYGGSTWSALTDSTQRDFRYISGYGSVAWGRDLPNLGVGIRARLQVSTLRDETDPEDVETLNVRKTGWLEVFNTISLSEFLNFNINASALYDSEYELYFTPTFELVVPWSVVGARIGVRRLAILPDHDEIYWPSKFIRVNDELQPESFWEAYGSLNADIIGRLTLLAEASYSRPESRITWEQLPGYVWEPRNVETSEAIKGEASLILNLIGDLSTFGSFRYQYFDNQRFDPEIVATGGISYGRPATGSITLGASFWNFQPLESTQAPEDLNFVYGRINKSIRKVLSIFIDGRYTFNDESVLHYRGMPQAGRIISFGANIVFGGLEE